MAQPLPAHRSRHATIFASEVRDFLRANFNGWHHSQRNVGGVSKTTLAVIPVGLDVGCSKAVQTCIDDNNAKNIASAAARAQDPLAEYIYLLDNRGQSLQSRPDHMVLTRKLIMLVKGAHGAHVATPCQLDGWACLTEAHRAVESSAMKDVRAALQRYSTGALDKLPPTCLAVIFVNGNNLTIDSVAELLQPTNGLRPPVAACVNMMLTAAILHTGFSDAGAKFRDRMARQEAARNYGDSIASLLTTPLKQQ